MKCFPFEECQDPEKKGLESDRIQIRNNVLFSSNFYFMTNKTTAEKFLFFWRTIFVDSRYRHSAAAAGWSCPGPGTAKSTYLY